MLLRQPQADHRLGIGGDELGGDLHLLGVGGQQAGDLGDGRIVAAARSSAEAVSGGGSDLRSVWTIW